MKHFLALTLFAISTAASASSFQENKLIGSWLCVAHEKKADPEVSLKITNTVIKL